MLWESQHSLIIDSHGEREICGLITESGYRQTFVKLVQSFATWMTLDRLSKPQIFSFVKW